MPFFCINFFFGHNHVIFCDILFVHCVYLLLEGGVEISYYACIYRARPAPAGRDSDTEYISQTQQAASK